MCGYLRAKVLVKNIAHIISALAIGRSKHMLTDGIGAPDPNPGNCVSVSDEIQLMLHLSKLAISGSSWRRGLRFHW